MRELHRPRRLNRAAVASFALTLLPALSCWAQTFSEPAQTETTYTVQTVPPDTFLTGNITLNVPHTGVAFGNVSLTMPNVNWWGSTTANGMTFPTQFLGGSFGLLQQGPGTATGTFTTCGDSQFCFANGFPQPLHLDLTNFSAPNAPPVTATLQVQQNSYAKMVVAPNILPNGIQIIGKALPASANALGVTLDSAAEAMGFNHFNWVQTIVSSTVLSVTCQLPGALLTPLCQQYVTVNGTVPNVPTLDPPFGGWGYQGASPGNPVRDSLPGYWDEQFGTGCPEVFQHYEQATSNGVIGCQSAFDPKTFVEFEDSPSIPGVTVFETSLAGVGCSFFGAPANCDPNRFVLIPGTQFQYSEVGDFLTGGNARLYAGNVASGILNLPQALLNSFPMSLPNAFQSPTSGADPQGLTGYQLSNLIIPLSKFLSDGGFTPDVLAADDISIAPESDLAGLDPQDAATLAAFEAGPTPTQSVPEPDSLPLLGTAILMLLLRHRREMGTLKPEAARRERTASYRRRRSSFAVCGSSSRRRTASTWARASSSAMPSRAMTRRTRGSSNTSSSDGSRLPWYSMAPPNLSGPCTLAAVDDRSATATRQFRDRL